MRAGLNPIIHIVVSQIHLCKSPSSKRQHYQPKTVTDRDHGARPGPSFCRSRFHERWPARCRRCSSSDNPAWPERPRTHVRRPADDAGRRLSRRIRRRSRRIPWPLVHEKWSQPSLRHPIIRIRTTGRGLGGGSGLYNGWCCAAAQPGKAIRKTPDSRAGPARRRGPKVVPPRRSTLPARPQSYLDTADATN
jgi:hypothetical protein